MQTFLAYPDFAASAQVLDTKRLGKQRVEAWQLIRAITGQTKGWRNHPAAVMWRQYVPALNEYGAVMCEEWIRRGYNDTMLERFERHPDADMPYWFGREEFHRSHQSNLLRKNLEYYSEFFPEVPSDLEYVWFEEVER